MYNRPGKGRSRVCRKALQYIRSAMDRQAIDQKHTVEPRCTAGPAVASDPATPGEPAPPLLIVLDTNASLDWLLFGEEAFAGLADALAGGEVRCLSCAAMRTELKHVLGRASLARYQPDCERTLSRYDRCTITLPDPHADHAPPLRCRDEDDQVFLDLALRERATWLLTRDRDLLCLARKARPLGLSIALPEVWCASRNLKGG